MIVRILLSTLVFFTSVSAYSQEHDTEQEHEFKRHSIKFILSHTYIPKGRIISDGDDLLIVPSLGLDYDYSVGKRFSLGAHFDMEIMNYVLEPKHDTIITRDNPFVISVIGQYEIVDNLWLGLGPGYEFEKHENLWLVRLTLEYGVDFGNNFSFGPEITIDYKESRTSAYSLGLTVGKKF